MSFLPLAAGGCFFYFSLAARAAALAISSFSPASGQPGNVVTVNGSGFADALLVQFNPISPTLADFTILSDTQLQLVIPVGAISGPLQVLTASASATSAASLQVAPVIAGFSPPSGAAGTLVFINGANFVTNGTTVVFSGQNASVQGSVVALTEVSATVPSGAVTGPITVMTSAGTSVSTNSFVISTTPLITGFSPTAAAIGTTVSIFGGNFTSPFTVTINGKNAAASLVSLSQLDATVPNNASTGPITVKTDFGSATTTSNLITGTGPIITDFSPTLGNSSTPVIIDGLNLAAATKATFNGKEATIVADQNTQLEVYPPAGSGIGPISITTPLGTATTSTNFTNSAASIVTDFNPVIGPPGTVVTIDGLNFSDVTAVTFNGASAAFAVLGAGGTQVSATVPNNATTGPIKITAGASSYITSSNFTVTTSAPVITGFSPTNGVRGQTVTLTGANFTELANPAVEFNGIAAAYQTPTSTTELMVNVPAGFSTGPITVLNSRGSATSTNLFYGQPWITSLSSTSAIVNASFTINGRSLLNASSVRVNGVNYNYSAASTQITATVPTNAGTGLIEIVTPGGDFISTNLFAILPKIYSFSPAIGPAGTVVTLSGTSLFDVTNVEFGGIKAASFTASTNQVQATVPVNGLTGPITVMTPYGNDTSSNSFTATKPSLLLLTKTANPIYGGPGTNVTFTLTVTNEGPSIVTSLVVADPLSTLLSYVSSSSTMGTVSYTNGDVICHIGILSNNASATIQVVAAPLEFAAITNSATIGFAEGNLVSSNNIAYAATYAIGDFQRLLSITNAGSGVMVTWRQSPVNFLLQRSTNLALPDLWQVPGASPFVSNGLNTYLENPSGSNAFFRLTTP